MSKLPSFQFYPGDWMKDPGLRRSSHAAKGVLMDVLCLMFESSERGVLATAGVPWTDEEVCAAIGGHANVTLMSLRELLDKGVLRRRNDGALYSARMVRDEENRVQARRRKQNQRLRQASRECHADVTPMSPRSSSSSSSSDNTPLPPEGEESEELMLSGEEKKTRRAVLAEAEEIYQAYPRKVGKPDALRAIAKALKKHSFDFLLEKVREYAGVRERSGEDPGFIPHPATWFNREQFNDDPSTWVRGGGGNQRPEPGVTPPADPEVLKPLGPDFQQYVADRTEQWPVLPERSKAWKYHKDLPVSVRDDYDYWRSQQRDARRRNGEK